MREHLPRHLRNNPTDAERTLWQHLRSRQLDGYRFRRQQPLGRYVVDFVCLERRLVIEVDGGQHAERTAYDVDRTAWLESRHFRVLRFWDNEVLQETEAVKEAILRALDPSNEVTSPLRGEGQDEGETSAGQTPTDTTIRARPLLTDAVRRLRAAEIEDAPLEARLLLAHVLGVRSDALLMDPDREVAGHAAEAFEALLARRLAREPLFYILGEREFYGLSFAVDRRALIPRPETELLVETALAMNVDFPGAVTIADVGTGSGCIAVSVALHLPRARLYALDISAGALDLARANALRHKVQDRITFLQGDLLAPLPEAVHIIVANPPYVPAENLPSLPPEIARYEPEVAVSGGPEGLATIRRLLDQAPACLRAGGAFLMEMGYGQSPDVVDMARAAFPQAALDLIPDLAGIPRVLRVRLPNEEPPHPYPP